MNLNPESEAWQLNRESKSQKIFATGAQGFTAGKLSYFPCEPLCPPVVTIFDRERDLKMPRRAAKRQTAGHLVRASYPGSAWFRNIFLLVENLFIRRSCPVTTNRPFPVISSCQKGLPSVDPADEWKGKCYANWETSL